MHRPASETQAAVPGLISSFAATVFALIRASPAGGTFWLRWNRFPGSYRRLIAASRSQVAPG